MTKWFRIDVAEGFQWLEIVDERMQDAFVDPAVDPQTFDGLRVYLLDRLGPYENEFADSPWFGFHALALRPRARSILEPLLGTDGEFCAVSCPGAKIDVLAVRAADVLDAEASDIALDEFGTPNHFMDVVMRRDRLRGRNFVRLPFYLSPVYVTERVVEAYERAGLTGLSFLPVQLSG